MVSKAPPPLIRSTKPFSVEIPEGSNSAKSRRSDVVPNDELDIHSKADHYHGAELDLHKALSVHDEDEGLHGAGFGEDHDAQANVQGIEDSHQDDHLAKLPDEDHAPAVNGPIISAGALKDRLAGGEAGHDLTDKGVNEARDALHDNLQGVATENFKDNLQDVGQDALHDNLQGVATENFKDNVQDVGQDALHDHQEGIGKTHVEDHIVSLPDTQGLKSGPLGKPAHTAVSTPSKRPPPATTSNAHPPMPSVATSVKKSAAERAHEAEVLMQAKLEKEKKLVQFHGRVDAIRKTVSGINHKLDELDEEEPPKL